MRKICILILALTLSLFISMPMSEATQKHLQSSLRGVSASVSHLQLKGTVFTKNLKPLAIIEDTKSGRVTMYEQGDILDGGFEIIHIARGEVVFKTLGGEYKLSFPAGGVLQPQGPATVGGPWYNVRRNGNEFLVDEMTVSNAMRRINEIMGNVKIKQCFIDGKPAGIIVTKFTPIGILREVGIKEGDVVRSINGFGLNTPHQIFTAYQNFKNEKEVKVDILRDNKPLLLTYKVKK